MAGRGSGESKLRIGRGRLGGRVIRFTADDPDLRPTLSRVREAVFNMICDYAQTHGFIDLCAGSGVMGFQACSLDFQPVVFIDTHPPVIDQLKKNAALLGEDPIIHRASAFKLDRLPLPTQSWLIYGDPPFSTPNFHKKMLSKLAQWSFFAPGSLYIAEQEDPKAPGTPDGFQLLKQKKYGRITVLCYEKTDTATD